MSVPELHAAAASGNLAQLQGAIKQVMASDLEGRTAMHVAAATGQDTALYLLAAAGARLEAGAGQPVGMPLETAAATGQAGALRTLLNLDARPTTAALHQAAEGGHVDCLQALLRTGQLDVNATDGGGRQACDLAAAGGHAAYVEALLAAGSRKPCKAPAMPTPPPAGKPAGGRAREQHGAAAAAAPPADVAKPASAAPHQVPKPGGSALQQGAKPAMVAPQQGTRLPAAAEPGMSTAAKPAALSLPSPLDLPPSGPASDGSGSAAHSVPQQPPSTSDAGSGLQAGNGGAAQQAGAGCNAGGQLCFCASSSTNLEALPSAPVASADPASSAGPAAPPAAVSTARHTAVCCWQWLEGACSAVRDVLADQLFDHVEIDYRPRTQREARQLRRHYRANPWAFEAARMQPAHNAANGITCFLFYVLTPLLPLLLWACFS